MVACSTLLFRPCWSPVGRARIEMLVIRGSLPVAGPPTSTSRVNFILRPTLFQKNPALSIPQRNSLFIGWINRSNREVSKKIVPSKKVQKFDELSGKNEIFDFYPPLQKLQFKAARVNNTCFSLTRCMVYTIHCLVNDTPSCSLDYTIHRVVV